MKPIPLQGLLFWCRYDGWERCNGGDLRRSTGSSLVPLRALYQLAYGVSEDFGVQVDVGWRGGGTHQGHVVEWS
jgi:hypothetical protein